MNLCVLKWLQVSLGKADTPVMRWCRHLRDTLIIDKQYRVLSEGSVCLRKLVFVSQPNRHGLIGFLCLSLCLPLNTFAKEAPLLSFIKKEEMMGVYYPVFQIDLYANGDLEYQGIKYVRKLGKQHAKITPAQVQELVTAYKERSAKWFDKNSNFHKSVQELMLGYKSENKVQFHWHGKTEELNYDDSLVDEFLQMLNEKINIKDWYGLVVNGKEMCNPKCAINQYGGEYKFAEKEEICPPIIPSEPSLARKIAHQAPILIFCKYGSDAVLQQNYQIDLYEDGGVYYRGVNDVKVLGDRHTRIKPAQVQKMIATSQKLYEESKPYSIVPHGGESIQFQYQGAFTTMYPGTYFDILLTNLNDITNVKQWLCYPKNYLIVDSSNNCPTDKSIRANTIQSKKR